MSECAVQRFSKRPGGSGTLGETFLWFLSTCSFPHAGFSGVVVSICSFRRIRDMYMSTYKCAVCKPPLYQGFRMPYRCVHAAVTAGMNPGKSLRHCAPTTVDNQEAGKSKIGRSNNPSEGRFLSLERRSDSDNVASLIEAHRECHSGNCWNIQRYFRDSSGSYWL